MDKLTNKLQIALSDAQSLAIGRGHQFIEPVHLMLALLDQDRSTVRHLLIQSGVNIDLLRLQLCEILEHLPQLEGNSEDVQISNSLSHLLDLTDKLAQKHKDIYISSELFVLASIHDNGELGNVLHKSGANRVVIEHRIEDIRDGKYCRS
jgi:ATP-dependent Clp protease ATP-binding subunit ClpB